MYKRQEVDLSRNAWDAYVDGVPYGAQSVVATALDRIVIGDVFSDATTYSGRGEMIVDDIVVRALNVRPAPVITSPTTFIIPRGSVLLTGTAIDPDRADGVERVDVSTNGGATFTSVPKGPTWSYAWDTTGLNPGQTYVVVVRAWQAGQFLETSKTYRISTS